MAKRGIDEIESAGKLLTTVVALAVSGVIGLITTKNIQKNVSSSEEITSSNNKKKSK